MTATRRPFPGPSRSATASTYDCDGSVDEDLTRPATYVDQDGDGFHLRQPGHGRKYQPGGQGRGQRGSPLPGQLEVPRAAAVRISGSILAGNTYGNLISSGSPVEVSWSDLYNPPGQANYDLPGLDSSNLTLEPGFLSYGGDGVPTDVHLALNRLAFPGRLHPSSLNRLMFRGLLLLPARYFGPP